MAYHDNGWKRNNPIFYRLQIYAYVYTTKTDRISLQDDTCSNCRYKDHNLNYSKLDSLSDDAITSLLLKLIYQNWQLYTYFWLREHEFVGVKYKEAYLENVKIACYPVTAPKEMNRRHTFKYRWSNQLCPNLRVNILYNLLLLTFEPLKIHFNIIDLEHYLNTFMLLFFSIES